MERLRSGSTPGGSVAVSAASNATLGWGGTPPAHASGAGSLLLPETGDSGGYYGDQGSSLSPVLSPREQLAAQAPPRKVNNNDYVNGSSRFLVRMRGGFPTRGPNRRSLVLGESSKDSSFIGGSGGGGPMHTGTVIISADTAAAAVAGKPGSPPGRRQSRLDGGGAPGTLQGYTSLPSNMGKRPSYMESHLMPSIGGGRHRPSLFVASDNNGHGWAGPSGLDGGNFAQFNPLFKRGSNRRSAVAEESESERTTPDLTPPWPPPPGRGQRGSLLALQQLQATRVTGEPAPPGGRSSLRGRGSARDAGRDSLRQSLQQSLQQSLRPHGARVSINSGRGSLHAMGLGPREALLALQHAHEHLGLNESTRGSRLGMPHQQGSDAAPGITRSLPRTSRRAVVPTHNAAALDALLAAAAATSAHAAVAMGFTVRDLLRRQRDGGPDAVADAGQAAANARAAKARDDEVAYEAAAAAAAEALRAKRTTERRVAITAPNDTPGAVGAGQGKPKSSLSSFSARSAWASAVHTAAASVHKQPAIMDEAIPATSDGAAQGTDDGGPPASSPPGITIPTGQLTMLTLQRALSGGGASRQGLQRVGSRGTAPVASGAIATGATAAASPGSTNAEAAIVAAIRAAERIAADGAAQRARSARAAIAHQREVAAVNQGRDGGGDVALPPRRGGRTAWGVAGEELTGGVPGVPKPPMAPRSRPLLPPHIRAQLGPCSTIQKFLASVYPGDQGDCELMSTAFYPHDSGATTKAGAGGGAPPPPRRPTVGGAPLPENTWAISPRDRPPKRWEEALSHRQGAASAPASPHGSAAAAAAAGAHLTVASRGRQMPRPVTVAEGALPRGIMGHERPPVLAAAPARVSVRPPPPQPEAYDVIRIPSPAPIITARAPEALRAAVPWGRLLKGDYSVYHVGDNGVYDSQRAETAKRTAKREWPGALRHSVRAARESLGNLLVILKNNEAAGISR